MTAFTCGDDVTTEYGSGTIVDSTDRSVTVELDSGDRINVQRGTPGYDRIRRAVPDCPNGHGPMTLREELSEEQAWCGIWYDCTPAEFGQCCKSSVLIPSSDLAALHAAVSDGT